jgi:hypothetical protein
MLGIAVQIASVFDLHFDHVEIMRRIT